MELFKNPFDKSKSPELKFQTLKEQMSSSYGRKGLQYPINLGEGDQQDFLLFTIYDTEESQSSYGSGSTRKFDGADAVKKSNSYKSKLQRDYMSGAMTGRDWMGRSAPQMSMLDTEKARSEYYKAGLDEPIAAARMRQEESQEQTKLSTGQIGRSSLQKTAYSVAIYMPSDITTNLGVDYNMENFGILGAAGAAGGNVVDMLKNAIAAEGDDKEVSGNLGEMMKQLGAWATVDLIDSAAGLAGINTNVGNAASAWRRKVINPHMQFLFDKVAQRSYSFDFTFTTSSIEEAKMVHDIVKIFRIASLPSAPPSSGGGVAINFPAEFDIRYFRGGVENTWIPRIARSVLTNFTCKYSGHGPWGGHDVESFEDISGFQVEGSPPIALKLNMSFSELSTLTREDVVNKGM